MSRAAEAPNILVIEDDDEIREGIRIVVEAEGYASTCASNGAVALEQLRQGERPAAIILDLMMPIMDGWEFRNAQLGDPELARIPVIVLSGFAEDVAAAAADEALPKPFTPGELVELLHRVAKPA